MNNKKIYFLSGLPRTGSTLLGSILAQNPEIHVTPTSPLYPLLVNTNECLNLLNTQYTFDHKNMGDRIYHSMIDAFYSDIKEPIIFDKHRGWPKAAKAIKDYMNSDVRIVCTIRPISEIITSYLVLADKDKNNFIDTHLIKIKQPINNESRANLLWAEYLKIPYETLLNGLKTNRESILLVDYRDIVFDLDRTLDKIYSFCGITPFKHHSSDIKNTCAESNDSGWGMENLHTIRSNLKMESKNPLGYLSKDAVEYFEKFDIRRVA